MQKGLIVIPAFNEQDDILDILNSLSFVRNRITDSSASVDILVIDDGSTDMTSQILKQFTLDFLITHDMTQGYGKSLIDGFKFAIQNNYDYLVTMDCDGQHEPDYIPEFFKGLKDFDIVSGSRYLSPIKDLNQVPRDRLEINKTITKLICQYTGYHITDAFCGFRGYQVEKLKRLKPTEYSYGLSLQLWIQAAKAGLTIKEIAVPLIYKCSKRDFKGVFKVGADLCVCPSNNEDNTSIKRLEYYLEVIEREMKDRTKGKSNDNISNRCSS